MTGSWLSRPQKVCFNLMTPGNCSLSLPPHPLSFSHPLLYCQATFGPFYWNIMQQSWWIFSSTEFSALHGDCALSENLTPQQPRPTDFSLTLSHSTLQCHCIRCLPKAKRADVASSRRKAKNIIIAIENCWWAPSGCQTTTTTTNRPAKTQILYKLSQQCSSAPRQAGLT